MQLSGALPRLADCNINARGRYGQRGHLQQWRRTFYYMRRLLHTTRSELDNMKKGNVLSKYWVVGAGLSDPRTSLRSVSAWCEEFAINGRPPISKSSVSALRSAFGEILRAINRQDATTYAKGATHGFVCVPVLCNVSVFLLCVCFACSFSRFGPRTLSVLLFVVRCLCPRFQCFTTK